MVEVTEKTKDVLFWTFMITLFIALFYAFCCELVRSAGN